MENSDIQRLRALPIESVAERLGLRIVRHKCLCPFHDDSHPSLSFSASKNTFKCFVCDAHGGVIDLAMQVLNKNFLETCQWLADEHNVIIDSFNSCNPCSKSKKEYVFDASKYQRFFEKPFISQAAHEFLFNQRHLDPRVIRWCRLNSYCDCHGTNWLQIPYYDIDGNLTGIQSRNLDYSKLSLNPQPSTLNPPRFRFPYGSQCHIYNLPVLKLLKPGEELWITEGCSDCWSMLSSGHKAIAIPSATLLKKKDLQLLSTLNSQLSTTFHMYPDQDIPGERLFLQLQQMLQTPSTLNPHPSPLTRHSLPSDCKDYSDYYVRNLCK